MRIEREYINIPKSSPKSNAVSDLKELCGEVWKMKSYIIYKETSLLLIACSNRK